MSRDVNGDYTLPTNDSSPAAPRNVIRSSDFNEITGDLATALTDSWSRSGKGAALADLDMGGFSLLNEASMLRKAQNLADLTDKASGRFNLKVPVYAADRTALKALDTANDILVYLKEDGREGIFEWAAGDFSAQITADTLEGVYIKADAIASTSGAWVRQGFTELLPKWFGAIVDSSSTDSGPAIQAAIDIGNLVKAPVRLPIGTLYTAQTLHVYAQSVLYGYGKSQSIIKAKDGSGAANDGKGILETHNFLSLINTETKFVTDAGMTWGFVLKGFTIDGNRQVNYGGVSGARYGGVGTGEWDGFGIRLYGRRYIVDDIAIQYCAGIGFYSEMGNPAVASPSDWYFNSLNDQQGHIHDVIVGNCSYDGFVFRGPGDILVDDITTYLCCYPDATEFGALRNSLMFPTEYISGMVFADKVVNTAVAGCEIGTVHSHTNKNGWGIRFQGDVFLRIRTDKLTSEGNLGQIVSRGAVIGQWSNVNTRNNNADSVSGDGTLPDIDIESSQPLSINDIESRSTTGNLGSIRVRIGSDGLNFGTINIRGGTAGHGVVVDTNVDHIAIDKLIVSDLRGTASDGNTSRALWTKSGATNVYIGIVNFKDNSVGWRNDSSGDIVLSRGRIEVNAATYPGSVPLDLATVPAVTSLKQCGFATGDGATSKFATFSGSASVDPTIITPQAVSYTHNLWWTPPLNNITLTLTTNSTVGNEPEIRMVKLTSVTSTTITGLVQFAVAGTGTSGGTAAMAKV